MSAPVDIAAFDVCGDLPTGVTVLEASAGTGKTFTIAGLAARYVAGGTPLDEILVVTFTRMATAELRDRVRERLVSAEHGLERWLAGARIDERDEVLVLLTKGTREEVEKRRHLLARALADFDAATIVTTHGFCQEVLGGLGIMGDLEPGAELIEDPSDLVEEVVDDLYVRKFFRSDHVDFDRAQALEIAREAALRNPAAQIEPTPGNHDVPAIRASLARAVRAELDARKRRNGVLTYDDLLTLLRDALVGDGGDEIAARLQARYSVVLVDEFQDTDPVQWTIMDRAFGRGPGTLVLIGDPKQAIYAFRGADVYAYLEAARAAETQTLDVNWRSDQGLIEAYDRLFAGAQLGHPGIIYRHVKAAPGNERPRLSGAPSSAPLRIRVVDRKAPAVETTRAGGFVAADSAREHIAQDLAADVVSLLSSGACIDVPDEHGDGVRPEGVRPGDIAVLVRRNADAERVRDALDEHGVPAVLNGAGSVFATGAATDWLRLLEAIERPASPPRAHAAALTAFLGWTPEEVAAADEDAWEEVHHRLHSWAALLRVKGVAALMEAITRTGRPGADRAAAFERLPERILRLTGGERRLTDLRHVAQLLHAAAMEEQLGVAALTVWLRRRIAAAAEEGDEERSRRLESDAAAVQVLTIHRSKGLEFPIVYLPYLWHPTWVTDKAMPVTYHDEGVRKVDVGLAGRDYGKHKLQYVSEQRGEDLRLAYVALTRAKHQAVVWWAGTRDSRNSALSRLALGRDGTGAVAEEGGVTPADDEAFARFEELAGGAPGCIGVEWARPKAPTPWTGEEDERSLLAASEFARQLDWRWRRTSYSDITAGAHDARVASEPEEDVVDDEAVDAGALLPRALDSASPLLEVPSLLADMPFGAQVGTFVHGVFEEADFAAPYLDAELARCVGRVQARRQVEIGDRDAVIAGLQASIETPLGPVLGDASLRSLTRADRLDELNFELPLVGGDTPSGRLTLSAIAGVLRRHVAPGDPLHGYADRLEDPGLRPDVRGYLTGSIDLVARVSDPTRPGGVPRFAVIDYKTNWLGTPDDSLTAWHYRPEALATEMMRSHYVLQALLYTVALHRYLRWRLPGYDAETNLAGFAYLFLRGMLGAGGPDAGVFGWRPSRALVEELSDVLDRGDGA